MSETGIPCCCMFMSYIFMNKNVNLIESVSQYSSKCKGCNKGIRRIENKQTSPYSKVHFVVRLLCNYIYSLQIKDII